MEYLLLILENVKVIHDFYAPVSTCIFYELNTKIFITIFSLKFIKKLSKISKLFSQVVDKNKVLIVK